MKKSVYSLVLMDDVIAEVDRLAHERNTNRSNLINQILAESIGFTTPEMKMRDIFSQLKDILSESCYQIMERSSDSMFSVKSAIRYKYRPTVKYSIELFREPKDIVGRLKVSFRTSSKAFTDAVENFFAKWMYIEDFYLGKLHPNGVPAGLDSGKYVRGFLELSESGDLTEDDIANAIGEYIKLLDGCIKFYFENIQNERLTDEYLEESYRAYLSLGVYIV